MYTLTALLLLSITCDALTIPPVQVITGAYVKPLPQMIIYEASAPQIYVYNITKPRIYHTDNILKTGCGDQEDDHIDCTLTKLAVANLDAINDSLSLIEDSLSINADHSFAPNHEYNVPIDINKIQRRHPTNSQVRLDLVSDSTEDIPYMYEDALVRKVRNIISTTIGDAMSYCCGLISQNDMESLFSNDAQVGKYLTSVSASVTSDHQSLVKVERQVEEIDHALNITINKYHQALDKLLNVENEEVSQLYKLQHARARTSMITAQIAQQLPRTTQVIRLTSILNHCRQKLIPLEIIGMGNLRWDLHVLDKQLKRKGYQLSLPLTNMLRYYQLPIADCTFTPNQILLKLAIPIRKFTDIELYELRITPFRWKNTTCHIQVDPTYVAVSQNKVTTISGANIHQCQQSNHLCYVPQYQTDLMKGTICPEKLFAKSTISELNNACKFTCLQHNDVIITQVDYHKFVITNLPE